MRFGSREIVDVCLRAKAKMKLGNRTFYKNEPVVYFETLKTSSLEGASATVYATGGSGNNRLIGWDGDKTLTITFEDALLTPESFSILAGAEMGAASEEKPTYIHMTSTVKTDAAKKVFLDDIACWSGDATGTPGYAVTAVSAEDQLEPDLTGLSYYIKAGDGTFEEATGAYSSSTTYYKAVEASDYKHDAADIFVMEMKDGEVISEPCIPSAVEYSADGKTTITCTYANATVLVDYYVKRTSNVATIEITPDKFGGNFYLEGSTVFRREADGYDMPAELVIPNGKIQSNFTLAMAGSGDPSTFSFVLDAFPATTKFDETKKVLAIMQIITDEEGAKEEKREKCLAAGG